MLKIFNKKRWITFEKAVKKYHPYTAVDFGITWVNPQDIIGLTFPSYQIKNDEKMDQLRMSVKSQGWCDKHPVDLHLYLLPNKKYTVCSGGNHRAYLSNELKIPRIEAFVTILIPEKMIPEKAALEIKQYTEQEKEYETEARKVNDWLRDKGIYRLKYHNEEKLFNEYCSLAEDMMNKRNQILLELAKQLHTLPSQEE